MEDMEYDLIKEVARKVARKVQMVEKEDLTQELWIWFFTNKESIKTEEEGGNPSYILYRACRKIAEEMRAAALKQSCQYFYRPSDVRRVLETVFDRINWTKTYVPKDAKSILGNDGIEISVDFIECLEKLSTSYFRIIFRRYALGDELNSSKDRMKLSRAISRLTSILNTYRGIGYGVYEDGNGCLSEDLQSDEDGWGV